MPQTKAAIDDLKHLGSSSTRYHYKDVDASLLERFPNPLKRGPGHANINVTAPEFTSLCPKTGQPDFATIVVEYRPRDWCVESKSWKLYLGSYRNAGEFHEACVRRIANDLIRLLDPEHLYVRGEFTPRGGIPFWPTIVYDRPRHVSMWDDKLTMLVGDYPPTPGAIRTEYLIVDSHHVPRGTAIGYEGGAANDYRPMFVETHLFEDDAYSSQVGPLET